jgi:hypothetical protein
VPNGELATGVWVLIVVDCFGLFCDAVLLRFACREQEYLKEKAEVECKTKLLTKRLEQIQRDVDELAIIADALEELDLFVAKTEEENLRCNERYCQQFFKTELLDMQILSMMQKIILHAELMTVTLRDWDQNRPDEFSGIAQFCHRLGREKILNRELTPLMMALMTLDPNWEPYMTGPKILQEGNFDTSMYLMFGRLADRFPQSWFVEHDWPSSCSLPHPDQKDAAAMKARLQQFLKGQRCCSLQDLLNTKTASTCLQQFCELMQIASFLKQWQPTAEGVMLLTSCLRSGSLLSSSSLQIRLRASIMEHFDLCSRDEQRQILEALTWSTSPQLEEWSNMQKQSMGLTSGPPSLLQFGSFPADGRYRELLQALPRSQPGAELVRELRERFP